MVKTELARIDQMSQDEVSQVYEIMRHAYAVTEAEIWGENYSRINQEEYLALVKSGEIYLARVNGKIAGSIAIKHLKDDIFSFGLLSAGDDFKGMGVGRALVDAVENHARRNGGRFMSIEILRPLEFELPFKKVLHDWYLRLGYEFTKTYNFLELKPDKVEKVKTLLVPSVFDCYKKSLLT